MSARGRAQPWFRAPGARYDAALARYEQERHAHHVEFRGGAFRIVSDERFYGDAFKRHFAPPSGPMRLVVFPSVQQSKPFPPPHCEQCSVSGADVLERATDAVGGMLCVSGVLRLRATLCGRCFRLLAQ